jgi:DNA polymerase-3 subunit delta'
MLYPWQTEDWAKFAALRGRLPHAVLLHGQPGIGKRDFAVHLARGLLCETPAADGQPCGTCASCHWFEQGNHPDFNLVRPEAEEEGDADGDDGAKEGAKKKAPSKVIRMEQVRRLIEAVGVGTHRGGVRVVVIYPLDMLQAEAANALLKTLEEPPPSTVFLLVTDRVDKLLPTILSRCRQIGLQPPDAESALAWLKAQGVADAPALLAESGNAPLTALQAAGDENRPLLRWLVEQLAQARAFDALAAAEQLQKMALPQVLGTVQRWVYDVLALRMNGRSRYFPALAKAAGACAEQADLQALNAFVRTLHERRRTEHHPLAIRLVLESLFLEYRQLFPATGSRR